MVCVNQGSLSGDSNLLTDRRDMMETRDYNLDHSPLGFPDLFIMRKNSLFSRRLMG